MRKNIKTYINKGFRVITIGVVVLFFFSVGLDHGPFQHRIVASVFERIFGADPEISEYSNQDTIFPTREITINGCKLNVSGGQSEDSIETIIREYETRYKSQEPYSLSFIHPSFGVFAVLDQGPDPKPISMEKGERFVETGLVGDLGGIIKCIAAFRSPSGGKTEIITGSFDQDFNLYNFLPSDTDVEGSELNDIPRCNGVRSFSYDDEIEGKQIHFQIFRSSDSMDSVVDCFQSSMTSNGWSEPADSKTMDLMSRKFNDSQKAVLLQKSSRVCLVFIEKRDDNIISSVLLYE